MSDIEREQMKTWVANWKQTGEELDRIKWEELQAMDERTSILQATQAFAMANNWLDMQPQPVDRPSGMVEQQYWFAKWPKTSI